MEREKFKFRTSYVTNRDLAGAAGKRLPLVLDWAVGNKSCLVAQKDNATYACLSDNHECVNSTNGPGYLCKCKTGYRGNPYRKNGCECEFSLFLLLQRRTASARGGAHSGGAAAAAGSKEESSPPWSA